MCHASCSPLQLEGSGGSVKWVPEVTCSRPRVRGQEHNKHIRGRMCLGVQWGEVERCTAPAQTLNERGLQCSLKDQSTMHVCVSLATISQHPHRWREVERFLAIAGPGLVVMLADTDAGCPGLLRALERWMIDWGAISEN